MILLGILEGFSVTASVAGLGLLYAVPFGFVFGLLQFFCTGTARVLATAVIEFWRSSSVVVLLFFFYYTLPLFSVTLSALTIGSMVLGLNAGGYASQAVRAALQAIPAGQVEAGRALGLSRAVILFKIELPQALPQMMPPFVNQVMQLVKGTALVSLIMLADMTYRAKEIGQASFNPIGIYSSLLLAYFIVCYPLTVLGRFLESRIAQGRSASHGL
jgi:polar amino acid transport system permease protein